MSTISPQEYQTRIAALERQCAALAAEVDRQRAVVEAAQALAHLDILIHAEELVRVSEALDQAVKIYEASREGADE